MATKKQKKLIPWTEAEEERLIKNVKNHVTCLKKAFYQTSKEIQRTPGAISAHWYASTSVKSGHCIFVTISGKHIAVNRKNGKGNKSTLPLYKKVLALLGLSY